MSNATAAPARDNVLYEKKGSIAYVTLNRPKVLNALNKATVAELTEVFEDASDDDAIRGVILTGTGDKAFAAGADIAEMANDTPAEAEDKTRGGRLVRQRVDPGRAVRGTILRATRPEAPRQCCAERLSGFGRRLVPARRYA